MVKILKFSVYSKLKLKLLSWTRNEQFRLWWSNKITLQNYTVCHSAFEFCLAFLCAKMELSNKKKWGHLEGLIWYSSSCVWICMTQAVWISGGCIRVYSDHNFKSISHAMWKCASGEYADSEGLGQQAHLRSLVNFRTFWCTATQRTHNVVTSWPARLKFEQNYIKNDPLEKLVIIFISELFLHM